jgi:DNA recombination protein RmuC
MNAYLSATESETEEEREKALVKHSGQVKERARNLSQKKYWQAFDRSPDFVVMFLPGEFLLQPALEREPDLMDWAMQNKVVIATPNTLMALLKTVEMGWREVRLARDAEEVGKLGRQIHERLQTWAEHMVKMGNSLNQTVRHFNSGVGSLESRVLTSARRFKELGVSSNQEIPEIPTIDTQVRELSNIPSQSGLPSLTAGREGDPD